MSWLRAHWEGIALVVAIALALGAVVLWRRRETPSAALARASARANCGPFPCR